MNVPVLAHHPLTVKHRAVWLASLSCSNGAHRVLSMIAETCLRRRDWQASQVRMAEMIHSSRRSIIRYAQELHALGYVRVIRRGKQLTNVYRLQRWLWERLTGRHGWQPSKAKQSWLLNRPLTEGPTAHELHDHERKKRVALAMLARAAGVA